MARGASRIEAFNGGDMFPFPDLLRRYFPDPEPDDDEGYIPGDEEIPPERYPPEGGANDRVGNSRNHRGRD